MNTSSFPLVTEKDLQLPLYLTSIGHWESQERTRRPAGFPDFQWLQVLSGTGELRIGDRLFTVKPGQGFFLFPREQHLYNPVTEPWDVHWIAFNGSLITPLLRQVGISQSGVHQVFAPDNLIMQMKNLYATSISGHPFLGMECSKQLYAFLLDLTRSIWMSATSSSPDPMKLHPVTQYIEENCHRPVTIAELADRIGVSSQYLCHLFKITLNMRPMEYVNRERIHKSKEWMFREPTLKIQEIAARVGFDNPSYFSSVFRKLEGVSPERFKKSHGM